MSDAANIVHLLTEDDGEDFSVKEVGPPPIEWQYEVKWDDVDGTWATFYTFDGLGYGMRSGGKTDEDKAALEKQAQRDVTKMRKLQARHPFPIESRTLSIWDWLNRFGPLAESDTESELKSIAFPTPPAWTYKMLRMDPPHDAWIAQFFFEGKPHGRTKASGDRDQVERWARYYVKDFNQLQSEFPYNDKRDRYVWQWRRNAHAVLESEEDDLGMKDMEVQLGLYIGARVRILVGTYRGGTGTVVGRSSFGGRTDGEKTFWVHLDDDTDDASSAITYHGENLQLIGDAEYPPNIRVQITGGPHAGPGYVTGAERQKQIVWVHPEGMEDPWGTVAIPMDLVTKINETEEPLDDFPVKELTPQAPQFTFKRESQYDVAEMTFVYVEDQFIGTIQRDLSAGVTENPPWAVTYSPRRYGQNDQGYYVWSRGYKSRQEAAEALWWHFTGHKKLEPGPVKESEVKDVTHSDPGQLKFRYEAALENSRFIDIFYGKFWIGRVLQTSREVQVPGTWRTERKIKYDPMWMPGNPAHPEVEYFNSLEDAANWFFAHRYIYPQPEETMESKARRAVLTVIEDENDEMKDFAYNPLAMAVTALKAAGFQVDKANQVEDEWIFVFSFPAPNITVTLSGLNRAKEVLEPFIPLRPNNYAVDRLKSEGRVSVLVRTRVEDDPRTWKVVQAHGHENAAQAFFNILFNDKVVGEVFCTGFSGARFQAEDIRNELVALHKILPFYPQGWKGPGNAWGSGPAVNWWRMNRSKLGKTGRIDAANL